ncbi:hypothetical protein F511_13910 [Dorcoceras hygrometricum]|uniref:RING-type E3 ubiquitin transferase n=1 Tax=Dorcoceras hygrometricum TaxID=472368 RepID=A0A2Z7B3B1_9LAMI|nr:hypothetical protein F511_13910 [Dorcoceras hygrometricum]
MWDPDYLDYVLNYHAEREIELPPSYFEDVDIWDRSLLEEEEEEVEGVEDEEDDSEPEESDGGVDVEDGYGSVTAESFHEAVNFNGQGYENAVEVMRVGERESSGHRRSNTDSKEGEFYGQESNKEVLDRGEMEGLHCPICFEPWSSGGDHHVSCLPCGHVYGLSCIKKWLLRRGSSKCPQCKKKCGIKDIRLLYASQIVAIDGELQKKVESLEVKCTSMEKKNSDLLEKEIEWKKREAELCNQVKQLKKRTHDLENLLTKVENRASGSSGFGWNFVGESPTGVDVRPNFPMQGCSSKFIMEKDRQVVGARFFDIDPLSKVYVIARRLSGLGGMHLLTKMSLLCNYDLEDIQLPEGTKAVKDLQVSPHSGLVLLASLGKKLSILSTESNNTILTYNLPEAAWSCSWDVCSQHYVYAGLQNGTVLQFDMRHTLRHVESLTGFTGNPVHTVRSLSPDPSLSSGVRSVLSASSLGLCHWNFGSHEDRYLIPESNEHGVCISLAYCSASDDVVASFRPKVEVSGDLDISQPVLTASSSFANGQGVRGSHVYFKRTGSTYRKLGETCANVSGIRLPKSAIIDAVSENPMFASGDEETCELVLQNLPSFTAVEHLKTKKQPIRDIRFTQALCSGLLSCLSDDSLQIFTSTPS